MFYIVTILPAAAAIAVFAQRYPAYASGGCTGCARFTTVAQLMFLAGELVLYGPLTLWGLRRALRFRDFDAFGVLREIVGGLMIAVPLVLAYFCLVVVDPA